MSEHGQNNVTLLRLAHYTFLGTMPIFMILVYNYFVGDIEKGGVYIDLLVGIFLSLFFLGNLFYSAKRGEFVLTPRPILKFIVPFFSMILIGMIIEGIVFTYLVHHYPNSNIWSLIRTNFLIVFSTFSIIDTLGIYWLEYHYGNKFYINKKRKS